MKILVGRKVVSFIMSSIMMFSSLPLSNNNDIKATPTDATATGTVVLEVKDADDNELTYTEDDSVAGFVYEVYGDEELKESVDTFVLSADGKTCVVSKEEKVVYEKKDILIEEIISFCISLLTNIIAYYVCEWLDKEK
jgi:hypothetical protein